MGPMCIPMCIELTTRLPNPQAQYSCGYTSIMEPSPSKQEHPLGLTHYHTLSVYVRECQLQGQINPGHNDLQIQNQGIPGDPCPELNTVIKRPKCYTHLGPVPKLEPPPLQVRELLSCSVTSKKISTIRTHQPGYNDQQNPLQ